MQSHGSAHHGPESWLAKVPLTRPSSLPFDLKPENFSWESVNGALLVFGFIVLISFLRYTVITVQTNI